MTTMQYALSLAVGLSALAASPLAAQRTITNANVTYTFEAITATLADSIGGTFTANRAASTDVLFEHWFYYRVDGDTEETPLKNDGTLTETFTGPHADFDWTNLDNRGLLSLQMDVDAVSTGAASGFVVFASTFRNISTNPVTLNFFGYLDVDICGTSNTATGTGLIQEAVGCTSGEVIRFSAPSADHWCVATFSASECGIVGNGTIVLPDAALPFGPGDYSGAVQWQDRVIAPGQTLTFVSILDHNPILCGGNVGTSVNYGAGYPGTHGLPRIGTLARPGLRSTGIVGVGNCLANTGAQLLIGTTRTNVQVANVTFLNNGIAVAPLTTDAIGGGTMSLAIPGDSNLCGVKLMFQCFFIDAGAVGAFPVAHTDGVEWTLGG